MVLGAAALAGSLLLRHRGGRRLSLGVLGGYVAMRALAGKTPVQALTELADRALPAAEPTRMEDAVTILRPMEEVYAFCREANNLLQFRLYLESVEKLDDRRVRSVGRDVRGRRRTLIAELLSDTPERLEWRKVDGDAPLLREVWTFTARTFQSGESGGKPIPATEVRCRRDMAISRIEATSAMLQRGSPRRRLREDLRRLRQLLEAGSVIRTEGQPHGRRTWLGTHALERLQQRRGEPPRQFGPAVTTPAVPERRTA
ncbi:MAG: hypothetical protein ACYC6M_14605 [Terriglobales bacterium]